MSINEVRYLPECGSTNAYVKEHFEEFGPVGAVYTENQTAGRGRLGRSWVNAEGKALYYTVAIREPLAQPATLPLLASLAVRTQLKLRYGVDCQIKWPNDLLLNGKKIVGILCEGVSYGYQQQGRGILCGIGINLAQPQSYFDAAGLPNGTSLALQGAKVDLSTDPAWLAEGLTEAFKMDSKVLVEEFIDGHEVECAVLGNLEPQASTVGEIAPTQEFYTFDAKYKDESSRLYIPAHITEEQIATVRQDAVRVYTALGCRGLSRVDFFVTHDSGEVVFNELNAIPGFTSISMYPKLFDYEGIGYAELLDRLISLALEEHNG
mgnify:CR=1 FL=1